MDTVEECPGMEFDVKSLKGMKFYYLGDMTVSRANAVDRVLARIKKRCNNLRDLILFFTSRVFRILKEKIGKNLFDRVLLCYIISEAWSVKEGNFVNLEKNDAWIVRWVCKC